MTQLLVAGLMLPCFSIPGAAAVQKSVLKNGMVILLKETNISDITACELLVNAGVRVETPETSGYTRLLQNILAEGQGNRSRENMEKELSVTGGYMNLDSTADFAEFTVQAFTENIYPALDILEKVVFYPAFTQKELDKLKKDFLENIKKRDLEAFDAAYGIFLKDFYGAHPYSGHELGTAEGIEKASADSLMKFYRAYYVPNNMILSCAGNFKTDALLKKVTELFGKHSAGALPQSITGEAQETIDFQDEREEIKGMDIKAVLLLLGFPAPRMNSEDYPAMRIINAYLGSKGGTTDLAKLLRDRLHLVEEVWTFYPLRKDPSHFACATITYPEQLDKARSALLFQIAKLQYNDIDEDKLETIKTTLTGEFLMDHEKAKQQAFYLAFFELTGLGYDYDEKFVGKIKNISAENIRTASQKYFNHFITIVLHPKEVNLQDYNGDGF